MPQLRSLSLSPENDAQSVKGYGSSRGSWMGRFAFLDRPSDCSLRSDWRVSLNKDNRRRGQGQA